MIQASELQLGNLYFHKGIIDDFKQHMVVKDYEEWDPIPLTDEWLEKMGMIWKSVPDSDGSEHNIYTATWGNFDLVMFDNWVLQVESIRMPHIKYVHQLQNLFRAITGQELEFNPKL